MWTTAKTLVSAVVLWLLLPVSVEAAVIQRTNASDLSSATSIATGNMASNPVAGRLLVAMLFVQNTTLTSCTDTLGNTYTATPQSPVERNTNEIYILYAVNVSTGVDAVTCTFAGTSTYTALTVLEISTNPASGVFVDDAIGVAISGTTIATDALSLSSQQSIIVSMFESDYAGANMATPTPGTGYSFDLSDGSAGYLWDGYHDGVTVDETAGATTGDDAWSIIAAAFAVGEPDVTTDTRLRSRLLLAGMSSRRSTAPPDDEGDATTLMFGADTTTLLANPETGPTWEYQNSGSTFRNPELSVYTDLGIPQALRQYGVTTLYANYWIGDFADSDTVPVPMSEEFLDQIAADLTTARANGYKLILGFHYLCGWHDPPADQIIAHVEQVGPILEDNKDVLAAMDWGMAGPCGEYGVSQPNYNFGDPSITSCNESDGSGDCSRIRWQNDNTIDIVDAWLANTPTSRMILYNSDLKRSYVTYSSGLHDDPQPEGPYTPGDTTLTATDAFSGSAKSRIGFENQCFLTDFTSYASRPWASGPTDYMAIEGKYVPQLYFPDTHCGQHPTDEQLMTEVNAGHWDFVSQETYQNWICDPACGWGSSQSNAFILQNGYRYRLVSADVPLTATHGDPTYPVSITITNDNAGMLFNPRKIELILRNQSTGTLYVTDWAGDAKGNRTLFPERGATSTWEITASLASVPAGDYDLLLNLPDPESSIHDDPLYSIRLANTDTWESGTGYNILTTDVVID